MARSRAMCHHLDRREWAALRQAEPTEATDEADPDREADPEPIAPTADD